MLNVKKLNNEKIEETLQEIQQLACQKVQLEQDFEEEVDLRNRSQIELLYEICKTDIYQQIKLVDSDQFQIQGLSLEKSYSENYLEQKSKFGL